MATSELVRYDQFEFRGNRIQLLVDDRGRFVSFSRACDMFGLNVAAEWDRVQKYAALAAQARIDFNPQTGRAVYYMKVGAFPSWLDKVPTAAMPDHLRALHTAFCTELVDAVYDFVTRGAAFNERILGPELKAELEIRLTEARTNQLRELRGVAADAARLWPGNPLLASASVNALTRGLMSIGGGGGQVAGTDVLVAPDLARMLGYKVTKADEGGVGKAVADAWRARNPGKKYDRKIDYTSCDGRPLLVAAGNGVNAYTEADREWMEPAIHAYYAAKAAGGATVAKKKK